MDSSNAPVHGSRIPTKLLIDLHYCRGFSLPRRRIFLRRLVLISRRTRKDFSVWPLVLAPWVRFGALDQSYILKINMVLSFQRKIPTLVDLCIQTAIDNIRYIGDVGETDIYLLKDILPHCTLDQLMHIEKSSQGRDLSAVTDNLWKQFYEKHFGEESVNLVIKRMKQKQVVFKWRLLYEAKVKERDEAQQKSVDRLKKLYEEEGVRKQSRQIQLCSKVPPSSKKRNSFGGPGPGNNFSNVKGNLMKKAKMEYRNSHEARVHEAMRKKELQRKSFPPPGVSRTMKPSGFIGKSPASSSKVNKPFGR